MAIYAIGDVQGCYNELLRLVDLVRFDPQQDELWFVGDLVNRGPYSLAVLRYIRSLGDAATVVLGNHDLHLLAAFEDQNRAEKSFREIIDAEDGRDLLRWLRHQRLVMYRPELNTLMVHAGIDRAWDPLQTVKLAREVEQMLRSDSYQAFLQAMYGTEPSRWSDSLTGIERLRFITNCLTRIRFCTADGQLDFAHKGPPGSQPNNLIPWFDLPERESRHIRIVCGHWSALELITRHDLMMIDTGCVWGRTMTAIRLDGPVKVFSVPAEKNWGQG